MDEFLSGFFEEASGCLDAAEAALLRARASSETRVEVAHARLASLAEAAAAQAFSRTERIARAAGALLIRGEDGRPMAMRALLRLRDVIAAIRTEGREPAGDDSDLIAAAEDRRAQPVAETLARVRDRLMEIAPDARDPRLDALLTRIAALRADIEKLEEDEPPSAPRKENRK